MAVDLDYLGDELEISHLLHSYCADYDAARVFECGVWCLSDDVALRGTEQILTAC